MNKNIKSYASKNYTDLSYEELMAILDYLHIEIIWDPFEGDPIALGIDLASCTDIGYISPHRVVRSTSGKILAAPCVDKLEPWDRSCLLNFRDKDGVKAMSTDTFEADIRPQAQAKLAAQEKLEKSIKNYWNEYTDEQKVQTLLTEFVNVMTGMLAANKVETLKELEPRFNNIEEKIRENRCSIEQLYDGTGVLEY